MKKIKLLPILGVLLFVYIVMSNRPERIFETFLEINYFYVVIAVAFIFIIVFLKGIKWRYVIRLHGMEYPIGSSVKVWCIGFFASTISPGRVGDAIRVFYLKSIEKKFGRRFSTIFVDRVSDLISVILFSMIGLVMISYMFEIYLISFGFIFFFIIAVLFFIYFTTNKKMIVFFAKPLFKFLIPEKYKNKLSSDFDDFYRSIDMLKRKKSAILILIAFSSIMWLLSIASVYFINLSLGINASFMFIVMLASIGALVETIPVSVMGLGTRETFFVFALSLIGIGGHTAIAFSLLYLIIGYWILSLIGFIFWVIDPVEIKLGHIE